MNRFNDIVGSVYRQDYAELSQQLDAAAAQLRDEDGRTLLMHAALAEDATATMISFLVERGAAVNAADSEQQWTALHFAARDGKSEIVRSLLDHGAQVDAVDRFGNTPLWRWVMANTPTAEIAIALLRHGADPRRKNHSNNSPLDLATKMGRSDLVRLFSEA